MVVRYLPNATASEELYHHGVDDQRWGVRHGPPYPLDPNPAKQAIRKKRSLLDVMRDRHAIRKKKHEEKEERKNAEENKKAIESGNAEAILKRKDKMSDEELSAALTRLELVEKIKNKNSEKFQRNMKTGKSFLETTAATLTTIATAAEAASKTRTALEKLGIVKERPKSESLKEYWEKKASIAKNKKSYLKDTEAIKELTGKTKKAAETAQAAQTAAKMTDEEFEGYVKRMHDKYYKKQGQKKPAGLLGG